MEVTPTNVTTTSTLEWDKATTTRITWLQGSIEKIPSEPFQLSQDLVVTGPREYFRSILTDAAAGPSGPRGSVLPADLQMIQQAVGPKRIDLRPSSSARGYRADWKRLRDAHVEAYPFCADCLEQGVETLAREIDHRPPLSGPDDPGRLDPGRLVSRCRKHHALITEADKKSGLTAPWKKTGAVK